MHTDYLAPIMLHLRDVLLAQGDRPRMIETAACAERLLDEIKVAETYNYTQLCERLAHPCPNPCHDATISGEAAQHDLRRLVEDLSDAADLRASDMGEPVHTLDELSKMFGVSSKTITRWRDDGLVGRRFLFEGRKRLGFLRSSVQRFVARHGDRIRRGEQFSHLSDWERSQLIEQARQMYQAGESRAEIIRKLSKEMNRSRETIRYTLKRYEEENPRQLLGPKSTNLVDESKARVYRQWVRGASLETLSRRFKRPVASVRRIVNEMRAKAVLELPLDFMASSEFSRPDIESLVFASYPMPERPVRTSRAPSGMPPYLASLYDTPLLTREQEVHLFRKLNYLKFKAHALRERLDAKQPDESLLDQIESLYQQSVDVKNRLLQANLRLVVSLAKSRTHGVEDLYELISDGNVSLMRAVEKFDYSRGNKFSTYATWSIVKNYARSIPAELKHRTRFRTSHDEAIDFQRDDRPNVYEQMYAQETREEQVGRILAKLTDREQEVIVRRFGIGAAREPLTLKEVGEQLGVTKERIRQLEARALHKLRQVAEEEHIALPD